MRYFVLLALTAGSLFAANNYYLDLGATIKGETLVDQFKGQISVSSFSYGGSILQKATGLNAIGIDKSFDSASPKILEAIVKGTRLPQAVLSLTKPDGAGKALVYARVVMKDVTIVETRIDGGDEVPRESITLNFDRADWCQSPQKGDGTLDTEVCTPIVSPK